MKKLLAPNQLILAKTAFNRVFKSTDPFDEPFQRDITERLIVYPTDYELEESLYSAVGATAKILKESTAFISLIEGYKGQEFEARDHWQIDFDNYPYQELRNQGWNPLMENAIYSINGTWGIIISHEQHAVVGGPNIFIDALKTNMPDIENQVQEFVSAWKYNRDHLGSEIGWLPQLLIHVYGMEKSQKLLINADLA